MRFRSGVRFPFRASVALVLLLLHSCTSWGTHSQGPESLLARKRPPRVIEVLTRDSTKVKISRPRIARDSIIGVRKDTAVSVALADVTRVKHPKLSMWQTTLVVLGVTFLAAGIAVGVSMN